MYSVDGNFREGVAANQTSLALFNTQSRSAPNRPPRGVASY